MYVTAMRRLGVALALGALATACSKKDNGAGSDTAVPQAAPANTTATSAPAAPATPSTPAMSDQNIVAVIGMANASEIAAGKTAQSKATNKDVKSFAGDMVKDHTAMQKSSDSLTKANASLKAQPPATVDSMKTADKAASDSLKAAKKGGAFDSLYIGQQVAAHQKVLDALNSFQNQAQDAGLKTLITGAIPKVQAHLQRAQQIQSSLGSGAAGDTTKKKP
jgi:putative membrane protein